MNETPEGSLSLAPVGRQQGGTVCEPAAGPRQTADLPHHDRGLPSPQNCEKEASIVYRPLSCWCCYISLSRPRHGAYLTSESQSLHNITPAPSQQECSRKLPWESA